MATPPLTDGVKNAVKEGTSKLSETGVDAVRDRCLDKTAWYEWDECHMVRIQCTNMTMAMAVTLTVMAMMMIYRDCI